MSHRSRGFTLIELMIVITIIGILASLAVSAYQTFTVRAQVSEGLNFAAGTKAPIVDAYTNGGIAPANRAAAGMTPMATDSRGSYVPRWKSSMAASMSHSADRWRTRTLSGPRCLSRPMKPPAILWSGAAAMPFHLRESC